MRLFFFLTVVFALVKPSSAQFSSEFLISNKVKFVETYITDKDGKPFSYLSDSLYYKTEYDSLGQIIKEDNLSSYKKSKDHFSVPFIKHWKYNTQQEIAETFSISKDYYLGAHFRQGGDTNFHYIYSYENGITIQETINHIDTSAYYNQVIEGSKIITKWKTANNKSIGNEDSIDDMEIEFWYRYIINPDGDTTKTMQSIDTTFITKTINKELLDSIGQVFPSFNPELYTIENRTVNTNRTNGNSEIKVSFFNKNGQICYHLFANGQKPKIRSLDQYIYQDNGLCDRIKTWSAQENEIIEIRFYIYTF